MTQGPTPPTGSVGNPLGEPVPTTTGATGYSETSGSETKETAKQEASHLAQTAGQSAGQVKDTAKDTAKETVAEATDQAKQAVAEAKFQARDLLDQTRSQLTDQSSQQQHRLAGGLRSFSGELTSLADGTPSEGLAGDLARQASNYVDKVGQWLEDREPADVLDEVSRYARRHPGTFIAVAAGLGLLAGRVARGLKDSAAEESRTSDVGRYDAYQPATGYASGYDTTATPVTTGTGTEYAPGYGTPTTGTTGAAGGTYGTGTTGGVYDTGELR